MQVEYSKITSQDKELFDIALDITKNAYAPFSKFQVGAALLMEDGEIITGVNIENSSFGATICAERTAFVKAISEGKRGFKSIAIAAKNKEAFPCGICRQFLYEFEPNLRIISGKDRDSLKAYKLKDMLIEGFRLGE